MAIDERPFREYNMHSMKSYNGRRKEITEMAERSHSRQLFATYGPLEDSKDSSCKLIELFNL